MWQQYRLCLAAAEHQNCGGFTFSHLGTKFRKDLVAEKTYNNLRKKVSLPMDTPAWQETQGGFFS